MKNVPRSRLSTSVITVVESVQNTKFLGVHIVDNLSWSLHTSSLVKMAQQHLHLLRQLERAHLSQPILTPFYQQHLSIVWKLQHHRHKGPKESGTGSRKYCSGHSATH